MTEPVVTPRSVQRTSSLLWVSFLCWILSLFAPALISATSEHSLAGLSILLIGWLGVVGVEDSISRAGVLAWWANPLYLLAISRSAYTNIRPTGSAYASLLFACLTLLVGNYATSEAPSYTTVIGYGPGVLLWFLAIAILSYVVSRDAGNAIVSRLTIGLAVLVATVFGAQLVWSAAASNDSEREVLPHYAAKRGIVCSAKAPPNTITQRQLSIELRADDEDHWLKALLHWGINAVQIRGVEYQKAREGTPESEAAPYMTSQPVTTPARYILRAQGGYPYINEWENGDAQVRLTLLDSKKNVEIGSLTFERKSNGGFRFCPSLTYHADRKSEEALKWLAPFLAAAGMK